MGAVCAKTAFLFLSENLIATSFYHSNEFIMFLIRTVLIMLVRDQIKAGIECFLNVLCSAFPDEDLKLVTRRQSRHGAEGLLKLL